MAEDELVTVSVSPIRTIDDQDLPWSCTSCGVDVRAGTMITLDTESLATIPVEVVLCDTCYGALKSVTCAGVVTPSVKGGGKVGSAHPGQSRRAAANVKAGSQQAALIGLVALRTSRIAWPLKGITCFDAADPVRAMLGRDRDHPISANQIATRMGELHEMGLVEPAADDEFGEPILRETTPGNEGQVWIATDAGILEAGRLAR